MFYNFFYSVLHLGRHIFLLGKPSKQPTAPAPQNQRKKRRFLAPHAGSFNAWSANISGWTDFILQPDHPFIIAYRAYSAASHPDPLPKTAATLN
jgi:hypothetical protein